MERVAVVLVAVLVAVLVVEARDLRPMSRLTNRSLVHTSVQIPAGGARVLDITYRLRPVHHHDCLPEEYMSWYRRCKLEEVEPGCKVIKECPHECKSSSGSTYKVNESWREGNRLCRCSHVTSVYYAVPPIPPGGQPYPPTNNCLLNGCRNPNTDGFMKDGDEVELTNGRKCKCTPGTDPNLMDSVTLYHLKCQNPTLTVLSTETPAEAEEPTNEETPTEAPTEEAPAEEPAETPVEAAPAEEPAASVEEPNAPEEAEGEAAGNEETPVA